MDHHRTVQGPRGDGRPLVSTTSPELIEVCAEALDRAAGAFGYEATRSLVSSRAGG